MSACRGAAGGGQAQDSLLHCPRTLSEQQTACALASAALALLINQLIGKLWHRQRPFAAHPSAHVWGSRSHDPSFPSDHASAAFGIAFAVFLFDRLAGSIFLAAAFLIGAGRVFIGAHYPADVLAGCLVGLGSALLVVPVAQPLIDRLRSAPRTRDRSAAGAALVRTPTQLSKSLPYELARGFGLPGWSRRAAASAGTATKMLHHCSVATASAATPIAVVASGAARRRAMTESLNHGRFAVGGDLVTIAKRSG